MCSSRGSDLLSFPTLRWLQSADFSFSIRCCSQDFSCVLTSVVWLAWSAREDSGGKPLPRSAPFFFPPKRAPVPSLLPANFFSDGRLIVVIHVFFFRGRPHTNSGSQGFFRSTCCQWPFYSRRPVVALTLAALLTQGWNQRSSELLCRSPR